MRFVKLALWLIHVGFLSSCAGVQGERPEKQRITLPRQEWSLREIFDEIEKQTGYFVARTCECGMLQESMEKTRSFGLRDCEVYGIVELACAWSFTHCGGWDFGEDRAILRCGLLRSQPEE